MGNNVYLIQLSDLHSCWKKSFEYQSSLINCINNEIIQEVPKGTEILVIICGDIIYKGDKNGYKKAINFLFKLREVLTNYSLKFCACPGNHDILTNGEHMFRGFNEFIWQLNNNSDLFFDKSATVKKILFNNIDLFFINSAYHGDIHFGKINLDDLECNLKKSSKENKILVFHHHLIPTDFENSTIQNAYELILLAKEYKVNLILHGHLHMHIFLNIFKNYLYIIGAGSVLFHLENNLNNQFNLLIFNKGKIVKGLNYNFIADTVDKGRLGSFVKFKLE